MKFKLLSRTEGVKRLILIFSGWSTEADYYSNIRRAGWDVGVITDYTDLSLDTSFLDVYDTVWVFAWSLGVKAAAVSLNSDKIQNAIAINGTLTPVDDDYGIPVAIYDGTKSNLNSRNLNKFQLRMVGDRKTYDEVFKRDYPDNKIDILKQELEILGNADQKLNLLPWTSVYLSRQDKIFPYENMHRFWDSMNVQIIDTDTPHCINLQHVISAAIPDVNLIAKKFNSAAKTYGDNASAQKIVADKLVSLIPFGKHKAVSILELGPGQGGFTYKYSNYIEPDVADYVDLVDLEAFGIAKRERYYKGDAEEYVRITDMSYDYILSSSVVQWFSNLDSFMRNCRGILSDGGFLCFSTYARGNLEELDRFRPAPLRYYSPDEIEAIARQYFNDVTILNDEVKLNFNSSRDLLMHLKNTGVSGIKTMAQISPFKLKGIRTLTYKPVYIIARNVSKYKNLNGL